MIFLAAMALDSKASFASRLDDLGLTDLAGQFDSLGWDTFGALAYATGTPGAPSSDSVLDERLIIPVLGFVTNRLAAQVRRLYFESVTIAAAELRRRVDRPADPLTATLPPEEREARRVRLQARLTGISISGDLEPAPSLMDEAYRIYEENSLKYVAWEDCPKFDSEQALRPAKRFSWAPDESGVVKAIPTDRAPTATISTLFQLSNALMRRGLAFDIANLMTFESHELIRRALLDALSEDPPPGYVAASMAQAERADRYLFSKLADKTRKGVRGSGIARLLDPLVQPILDSSKFNLLLSPLESRSGASSSRAHTAVPEARGDSDSARSASPKRRARRKANAPAKQTRQEQPSGSRKGGSRGKDNGRGKDSAPMPQELRGHLSRRNRKAFCFSFNLSGCPDAPAGGQCKRGAHECCHRDCINLGTHGFRACPMKR